VPIHRDDERVEPGYDFICVEDMLERLNEKRDLMTIVILDACRGVANNTTSRRSGFGSDRDAPAFGKSLSTRFEVPDDLQYFIVYSCDAGSVSLASEPGENSLFTAALLENLAQPGMEIESLFKETSKQLRRLTGGKQRSWYYSHLSESFYFNPQF
jgi:uncharacterized caspase-like protein